jgi:uncharacterized protein YdeI (YjbR/CyaY-like superfamily)
MSEDGMTDYPVELFAGPAEWEAWLEQRHAVAPGVWLRLAKKASTLSSVTYAEAVEVALCYGWIDGQSRSLDDDSWLQKFTPRGRRSIWSRINCERVELLMRSGRMRPAGLAVVEAAKADGRWQRAYDSPANATVPDDFGAALAARPAARAFFDALTGSARYAFLHRIQTAVRPETRARRIAKFVDMLQRGETLR